MKFAYQARTKEGKLQTGIVEASSKEAALDLLQKHNLYVTFLEESTPPFYSREITIFQGVTKKELVIFFRQLAVMCKSKVPLVEALETLANETKNKFFKEKISKAVEEIEGGSSLSKAFSLFPDVFPHFTVAIIKSGEVSGKLPESLEYLADHLEREYEFADRIKGAMIYPAFVLSIGFIIVILMVNFVLPQIEEIFKSTGAKLPWFTKLIFQGGDFIRSKGPLVILFSLSFLILIFALKSTFKGKKIFSWILLHLPIFKEFLKKIYLARIAENLSTLISAGLPITTSLEITSEIVGNEIYKEAILKIHDEVKKGSQISTTLAFFPELFPPVFVQMTLVGEKTGSLEATLKHLVEFYQKEVTRAVESFLKILEPILIVTIAVGVAIFAAAVIIPIYKIVGEQAM